MIVDETKTGDLNGPEQWPVTQFVVDEIPKLRNCPKTKALDSVSHSTCYICNNTIDNLSHTSQAFLGNAGDRTIMCGSSPCFLVVESRIAASDIGYG